MKLSPRDKFLLTAVGLGIVVLVIAVVGVWPLFGRLNALSAQIKTAQADLSSQQALVQARAAIKDRAAENSAKWLALGNLVPDRPDLPALIIEIQDVASMSGVKVVSVTPAAPELSETKDYTTIPVELLVVGSWADTVDFMQQLPKLTRGVRTVMFDVSIPSETNYPYDNLKPYTPRTQVLIEAYSIPPASALPTAPAPAAPAAGEGG
jgi:Tfp pilus assembly protein PilO